MARSLPSMAPIPTVEICGLQVFAVAQQKKTARRTAKELLAMADALIADLRESYGFEVREFRVRAGAAGGVFRRLR